jgi:hypothetical protein
MKLLLPLAVRVKSLGDFPNGLLLSFTGIGKWERVEASRFVIARIIADTEPPARRKRPMDMDTA